MPFAASTTIRSGAIASRSTKPSTRSTKPSQTSTGSTVPARRVAPLAADGAVADLEQPRLAADRQRAAAHDLHPGVLGGVVRGGDHDPAVEPELPGREVDHLGADHPEVGDVDAAVGDAVDHRLGHRRRREAHVAPDRDPPRLELLRERAPDRVRALLVELRRVERAHVVRLEGRGIEHGADAKRLDWLAWAVPTGQSRAERPGRCAHDQRRPTPDAPRIALIASVEATSGDSEITVAGRSKRASASASGSARSVPSP